MKNLRLMYDGKIIRAGTPIIEAGNRGFRYGDGLFETIRVKNGSIPYLGLHADRLLSGLDNLGFEIIPDLTAPRLEFNIKQLCRINGHTASARVRLMVFRGNTNPGEPDYKTPHFILETAPLQESRGMDAPGCVTGIYAESRKAIDFYSRFKTNNFQPYNLAAVHAYKMGFSESIVLNTDGNVCETNIANIFLVKNGTIITPSLAQGCISGVMRKHLLLSMPDHGIEIKEDIVTLEMLKDADEVFLTNSIKGLRWVAQIDTVLYTEKRITTDMYNAIIR